MKRKVLIFGVDGQDGALMSLFLIKKKYEIIGTYRKKKLENLKKLKIYKKIKLIKCNLKNYSKIKNLIKVNLPDEIYNFAGVSTLKKSEKSFIKTDDVNNRAVLNIMLSIKEQKRKIKFFQSLSSEVFNKDQKINFCSENSKFDLKNSYAISKISSYNYLKLLRKKYDLKLYAGFLFNHASYFSRNDFLVKKIIENFYRIKNKNLSKFKIGNINAYRDWIFTQDLIKIVWKIVQLNKPTDFVIGSGKLYSVKKVVNEVAKNFGFLLNWKKTENGYIALDIKTKKVLVETSKTLERIENNSAVADIKKLKKYVKNLKITNFQKMIKLICNDQKRFGT